jgi:hypothetical protein
LGITIGKSAFSTLRSCGVKKAWIQNHEPIPAGNISGTTYFVQRTYETGRVFALDAEGKETVISDELLGYALRGPIQAYLWWQLKNTESVCWGPKATSYCINRRRVHVRPNLAQNRTFPRWFT